MKKLLIAGALAFIVILLALTAFFGYHFFSSDKKQAELKEQKRIQDSIYDRALYVNDSLRSDALNSKTK